MPQSLPPNKNVPRGSDVSFRHSLVPGALQSSFGPQGRPATGEKMEHNGSTAAASHNTDPRWRARLCFQWRMQTVDEGKTKVLGVKTQAEDGFLLRCPCVTDTQLQDSAQLC